MSAGRQIMGMVGMVALSALVPVLAPEASAFVQGAM